jgi:hypothetical protein
MFTFTGHPPMTVETSDAECGDNLLNRSSLRSIHTDGMQKIILPFRNSREVRRFIRFSSFILPHGHRTLSFAPRTPESNKTHFCPHHICTFHKAMTPNLTGYPQIQERHSYLVSQTWQSTLYQKKCKIILP